jgi:protein involved in polysaccharide export with SLBB domain
VKTLAALLLLILAGLAAPAQTTDKPADAKRDAKGFLPLETAPVTRRTNPVLAAAAAALTAPPTNAPAPAPVPGPYVLEDKHKLLPGDRVSFNILEDRTNAIPLLVAESSELDVPYIGRVSVAGMTCKQAAEAIKALLEKDYYYKATVIIGLDAITKVLGKVYVFGPVRNPGAVEIPAGENFTAGKAIVRVGGFGDFANKRKVQIVRNTESGKQVIVVNMERVLEEGKTEEDVPLQPEDYIIVPQRAFNF